MKSIEKYNKMLSLEPYNSRHEIPVYPMMITTVGPLGGKVQREMIEDHSAWLEAIDNTIRRIGKPDVFIPDCPSDSIFGMGLRARVPGVHIGDNELYQFLEYPFFDDPDEYERIYKIGWAEWFTEYMMAIQDPVMTDPGELWARYGLAEQQLITTRSFLQKRDIVPSYGVCANPIYDALSQIRTMADFICDLMEDPGPIMDIINKYQPMEDEANIERCKAVGGTSICLFAMRSSITFTSPDMFREYIWPSMRDSVLRNHAAGLLTIIHADSNWLPMLSYFTQLPKGCCHFELDGVTNIFDAYEILRGSQSIRGDVPSTMFAYRTADEVSEYCEKLVNMGMKGGFMLGSGCEIPMNCKPENVIAMMNAVR